MPNDLNWFGGLGPFRGRAASETPARSLTDARLNRKRFRVFQTVRQTLRGLKSYR